jgi:hypothetical protein
MMIPSSRTGKTQPAAGYRPAAPGRGLAACPSLGLEPLPAGGDPGRGGQAVFVCGIAGNQGELLDLFDRVFLLRIDERTQQARLAAHDAAHPPGRSEAGRQEILQGRASFETQMIRAGAAVLDGTAPTAAVAEELLALAAAT